MRRTAGYIAIFVVGFGAAFVALRGTGLFTRVNDSQAKQAVLRILNEPLPSTPAADSALIRAAAIIQPAVVNIDTMEERRQAVQDFLGNPLERQLTFQGKGSGVIISPDGYVVTNNHVIDGANIIRVTMVDGRKFDGRLIGADKVADLAVVKIDGPTFPIADFGNSDQLRVGEQVLALGNPLGVGITVTHGIISATDRHDLSVGDGRFLHQAIQTDAPINRGNSGGALANLQGQLIGINSAIASENGGGNIGIGFAIPINAARSILKAVITKGRTLAAVPESPFVGIVFRGLGANGASELGLPSGQGVLLVEVKPLTPAADAGLAAGDVLVEVNGKPIKSDLDVKTAVTGRHVGDEITFGLIRRNGTREQVKVVVGRKPEGLKQR